MNLKTLIARYNTFYSIYKNAVDAQAYDREVIVHDCKQIVTNDTTIDKEQTFYYLKLTQGDRTWHSQLCFSYGEAMARKTYATHRRYNAKFYLLELKAQTHTPAVNGTNLSLITSF